MRKLVFESDRLIIRPLENSDFQIWSNSLNKAFPKKNIYDTVHPDEYIIDEEDFYRDVYFDNDNMKKDFTYKFGIFLKQPKYFIGYISAMDISRGIFQNAYIGYALINTFWNKGYGREAVSCFTSEAMKALSLHRFEAGIEIENIFSKNLIESCGYRYEGISKKRLSLRKEWRDILVYAITEEDLITNPQVI